MRTYGPCRTPKMLLLFSISSGARCEVRATKAEVQDDDDAQLARALAASLEDSEAALPSHSTPAVVPAAPRPANVDQPGKL